MVANTKKLLQENHIIVLSIKKGDVLIEPKNKDKDANKTSFDFPFQKYALRKYLTDATQ